MHFFSKVCLISLFGLLGLIGTQAQQTSPVVINSGGGSVINGGIVLEINIGEFGSFSSLSSLYCTPGFLQPYAGVTNTIPPVNNVKLDGGSGIDNAGTTFTNNDYMLEFTVGEMASITFTNAGQMLTQGILQSFPLTNPLPVTGLEFFAKRLNAAQVELSWKTKQEMNNKGFQVERKMENETNFKTIGFVHSLAPGNNSILPLDYKKLDNNNSSGKTWYRLKQEDLDGAYSYSLIRIVNGSTGEHAAMKVWPVPSAGPVKVLVTGIDRPDILKVFDITGRMVAWYKVINNTQLDLNTFMPGVYILRLEQKKDIVQKILIQ